MSKNSFIKGTFILTTTGIATRFLGFLYKIFLSRTINAGEIGIYQLVMPVLAIGYAAGIAGFEVSMSRFTAYYSSKHQPENQKKSALLSTAYSLMLCVFTCLTVYSLSGVISKYVFHNPQCKVLIKYLLISLPFSCLHSMINSYYLGKERTLFPSFSIFFEQIIRFAAFFIISCISKDKGISPSALTAVKSLLAGEIMAAVLCITVISATRKKVKIKSQSTLKVKEITALIFQTALPVGSSRFFLHLMQSVEIALIPLMLSVYGFTQKESLETLGIITGMALPIIFFPATLTNSVSILLLPAVSRIQDHPKKVAQTARKALLFSISFGLLCILALYFIGAPLSSLIFKQKQLAAYVRIMCFICPFMFTASIYKSMLNAMGHSVRVFTNNMLSELINIIFIVFLIPVWGIKAYLAGLIISQISSSILNVKTLNGYYSSLKN